MDIKEYFRELRFSPAHHLGAGDIRLTMGQQEELEAELAAEREKVAKLRERLERFCGRVENGTIKSKWTYELFKQALEETK